MKNSRPYIHPRRKYKVKKLNNFKCINCLLVKPSYELEIDHRIPISAGGTNDLDNLIPLCIECHIKKTKKEWKDGTFFKKSEIEPDGLTPKEKLDKLKEFIIENSEYTYAEVVFMILNHPLLSKFEYNSNIVILLFNEINGIEKKKRNNDRYLNQRDKLINILDKELNLTLRKLEKWLKDRGFGLSYRQIGVIRSKFDKKDGNTEHN